ncbi:uncharacterized protein LOC117221838 isoform X1 [Megalopta genalis]|uniref:uncharacterized protein LOC117221838 isoform X1 n=1 Tax=Megalopta genalis TaxID=115081 RepID=UPI003FD0599A
MGKVQRKKTKGREQKISNEIKKRKNVRLCYPKENVALALQEIHGGSSIAQISQKYNIPESTLRAKKLGLYADKKPGPATVLNTKEEKDLVDWILECSKRGFPVIRSQLIDSVQMICQNMKKKNQFRDNKPGRSWYDSFLKRHEEIAVIMTENVSLNRAKVSEHSLRNWFQNVSNYLREQNLLSIEANRIFSSDEIGLALSPKPPILNAPKECKNVYNIVNNNEKENITVLVTSNAAGDLAPTFVLFNEKSLPNNAAEMTPSNFAFGFSDSGCIHAKNFYEFITNVFEPWLTEKRIKRPIILYINSNLSHMTLHLSKFCSENEIVLIALHPNTTNLLQPLKIDLSKILKAQWQKTYKLHCKDSLSIGIRKYLFAPLLNKTLNCINIKTIMQNGFKKCGLYPFDVEAIDFSKLFTRMEINCSSHTPENGSESVHNNINSLKVLESLLTIHQLQSFRLNTSTIWKGMPRDESLFEIWYKLSHPDKNKSG